MRTFDELDEREILALAISSEEEDGRIYADFAHMLHEEYPDSAQVFAEMAEEESEHRRALIDAFAGRFGNHIPLVRRQDVRGAPPRRPAWQVRPLGIEAVRRMARQMEVDASRFYRPGGGPGLRRRHPQAARRPRGGRGRAPERGQRHRGTPPLRRRARGRGRQRPAPLRAADIQPGLVGLIDGSVSTLAPLFAAAFATRISFNAFLVGLAASIGAGISMAFAEALSDDGKLSGRGNPLLRGLVCGVMTTVGGIGHTLPYLIPSFYTATVIAFGVVIVELATIAWVQWKYMDTPLLSSVAKVMLGGALVLAAGILIGSS